jgi:hypothetical protein
MRLRRSALLGLEVVDREGGELGTVVDTYPFDGGGEPELAVLRLGRLGERRMVPVSTLHVVGMHVRVPFARWQVEDSPSVCCDRYGADDPHRARSYWSWIEPPVGTVRARCLRSSGSFGMVRRSLTMQSPTPIGS